MNSNLVRVGNILQFGEIENNFGSRPLSDEMLSSGYISLDGSVLSIENLEVSSGTIANGSDTNDTYGTYFLDFDKSFSGTIDLTYDIVNSSGESVKVARSLEVVDKLDAENPLGGGEIYQGATIDQWYRSITGGPANLGITQTNSSTYVREYTLTNGDNSNKWDPQLVSQDGSAIIFRQQFLAGTILGEDPNVQNVNVEPLVFNLEAQNGSFSQDDLVNLNGSTTRYTPNSGFAGYDVITFDVENLDGVRTTITKTIEVVPTDYSSLTILSPEEPVDPLTGFNVAGGSNFSATYYRDVNINKEGNDKVVYKGSDGSSTYFVVKDALDDLTNNADFINSETKYSLMLVERGESAENALDSGDYLLSGSFTTESSKRDFVSFDNDAINEFKDGDNANQKYDVILYEIDNGVDVFTKSIGSLEKATNDAFDDRYARLFGEATDFASVDGIETNSFL